MLAAKLNSKSFRPCKLQRAIIMPQFCANWANDVNDIIFIQQIVNA